MTKQEAYEKVVAHLLKQKSRALVLKSYPDGNQTECKYSTSDGKRCAIGCLIPDGHAALDSNLFIGSLLLEHPDLLGPGWNLGAEDDPYRLTRETPDIAFLDDLRMIHDVTDIFRWPEALKNFAKVNSLTVPAELASLNVEEWSKGVVEWKAP